MVSPGTVSRLLALSGERDQWQQFGLEWARWSYRSGYCDGRDDGYRAGFEEAVRGWKVTAGLITGEAHAELEARRWGPGGREHFGDLRPGDYPGRQHG